MSVDACSQNGEYYFYTSGRVDLLRANVCRFGSSSRTLSHSVNPCEERGANVCIDENVYIYKLVICVHTYTYSHRAARRNRLSKHLHEEANISTFQGVYG